MRTAVRQPPVGAPQPSLRGQRGGAPTPAAKQAPEAFCRRVQRGPRLAGRAGRRVEFWPNLPAVTSAYRPRACPEGD